jgi:chemotaxis protein CheY-P-specific phosphatase CheC
VPRFEFGMEKNENGLWFLTAPPLIRQMVGHQVLLSVPAVEILSKEAAAKIVGTPDSRILVAVRQDFTGRSPGARC